MVFTVNYKHLVCMQLLVILLLCTTTITYADTDIAYIYAYQGDVAFYKDHSDRIGLIDNNQNILIPAIYTRVEPFIGEYAKVSTSHNLGAKEGLIKRDGTIILKPNYMEVRPFVNGYAIVKAPGSYYAVYNYIDHDGNFISDNWYSTVNDFGENGIALVQRINDDKYCFINTKGIIVSQIYDDAKGFSNGLAAVKKKAFWGYIDEAGKTAISFQYDDAQSFSSDVAAVIQDNKVFYINKEGKVTISADKLSFIKQPYKGEYYWGEFRSQYFTFKNNIALVPLNNSYTGDGFIDRQGNLLMVIKYEGDMHNNWMNRFSEGLLPVVRRIDQKNQHCYINDNGEIVLYNSPTTSDLYTRDLGSFSEGLAAVAGSSGKLYINKSAKVVIETKYKYVGRFINGYAWVTDGTYYGFINKKGETIGEIRWDDVQSFAEDRALVNKNGYYGYINTEGSIVIPIEFRHAESFENGFARVNYDMSNDYSYINPAGEIIAGNIPD